MLLTILNLKEVPYLEVINKFPLLNKPDNIYTSSVIVDDNYYFTMPLLNIINKYDPLTLDNKYFQTIRPYNSITYNNNDNLFYLSSSDDKKNLYVTDTCFNEIDSIKLNIPKDYLVDIKNIYYYEKDKKIMITTINCVYSITTDGYFIKEEIKAPITYKKLSLEEVIANHNGCQFNESFTPSIQFTASSYFCDTKHIAYKKYDCAYLVKVSDKGNIIEIIYVDDDITINSIMNDQGRLKLLITKNNMYNYIYTTNIKCCKHHFQDYNYPLKKQCFNEHMDCKQLSADILESIANIEKVIADILNIESLKIDKVLNCSDNQHDIIKTNESVNKTIQELTMLEHMLLQKTELAISLYRNKE